MSYHLENSSAGNTYFTNAGSAISDTTQPTVDSTVMAGVNDDSIASEDYGFVSTVPYEVYTGNDDTSIIRGYTTRFKEKSGLVTDDAIQINGSDFNRPSIPYMKHQRVSRVKGAIRSGYWNEYTGGFSTLPTNADDISAFGADDEADNAKRATPGEFTFTYHGSGYRRDYPAKTQ